MSSIVFPTLLLLSLPALIISLEHLDTPTFVCLSLEALGLFHGTYKKGLTGYKGKRVEESRSLLSLYFQVLTNIMLPCEKSC